MQRKGIIALGFLVGVAIVAGILRIKFYFDPPQDNFNMNISNFLAEDAETTAATDTTVATLTATPQAVDTIQYTLAQQYDLGDGIVLDGVVTADKIWTIQLQGSELAVQAYDLTWQPVVDSRHVVQTDVQLVAGLPPQAVLNVSATSATVVQTLAQGEGLYDVVLRRYDTDWVEQTVVVLHDDLSIMEGIALRMTDAGLWLLLNAETIEFYTLTGILVTTQDVVIDATGVCDLIPDQADVVLVLESSTTMTLQKRTQFGEPVQAVTIPRPNSLVGCEGAFRDDEQLIIQLGDSLVPYADNLSEQYQPIPVLSTQLFPRIQLSDQQVWILYSTSATLGNYQMHVQVYNRTVTDPGVEAPLDATTEYIN